MNDDEAKCLIAWCAVDGGLLFGSHWAVVLGTDRVQALIDWSRCGWVAVRQIEGILYTSYKLRLKQCHFGFNGSLQRFERSPKPDHEIAQATFEVCVSYNDTSDIVRLSEVHYPPRMFVHVLNARTSVSVLPSLARLAFLTAPVLIRQAGFLMSYTETSA